MTAPAVIDTHCHLDFADYGDDRDAMLERARAAGVAAMICIGSGHDLSSARGAVGLAEKEPDIWATVGVHPHDAAAVSESDWDELHVLARHARVVGIGETGLDYHYDHSPRATQAQVFRRFVALARSARRPIISHVRDAHADALEVLVSERAAEVGGVIHCFTGGVDEARGYLDLGHYLSFSGIVTFKNAEPIRQAARFAPLDRILIETDAPYLAPVPHRGRRNEPAYVVETLKLIAELRQISVADAAEVTTRNARALFGLPS